MNKLRNAVNDDRCLQGARHSRWEEDVPTVSDDVVWLGREQDSDVAPIHYRPRFSRAHVYIYTCSHID